MSPEAGERSFDELAVGLSSGKLSRGKALKLMGAALVGGTLASLGIREAAATPPGCTPNGESCRRDRQCCSGTCSSHGTCVGAPGAGGEEGDCVTCYCGHNSGHRDVPVCTGVTETCVRSTGGSLSFQCRQFCEQRKNQSFCGFRTACDSPEGCPGPA